MTPASNLDQLYNMIAGMGEAMGIDDFRNWGDFILFSIEINA